MGNKNKAYRKGADYERKLVKQAKEKGCISFRSAGSHSPIDVCIIDHKNKLITFVQAKAGDSYSTTFKRKLQKRLSYLQGIYAVEVKIMDGGNYEAPKP